MVFIRLFLIGVGTGIIGVVLGIGGGVIIVPLLTLVLKLPIQNAVAISLAAIVAVSFGASISNFRNHLINLKLALILEPLTAFTAILASRIALGINPNVLKGIFGFFMFLISFLMLKPLHFRNKKITGKRCFSYFDPELKKEIYYDIKNLKLAALISSLAGFASGLLGVGGGVLKVPILNEVCRVPMRVATATSSLMVGITALSASLVYFRHSHLDLNFAFWVILGAVIGSVIGILIKRHLDNYSIKEIFSLIMFAVGLIMIFEAGIF